jgi:hypothetical protein
MRRKESDDDLRKFAAAVANRQQFAKFFDAMPGRKRKFMVLAMLNPQEPYFEALKHADENDFLDKLFEELAHAGVAQPVTPRLEAITRSDAGMPMVAHEVAAKLTASRRLCCITVLKTPGGAAHTSGTGFLVGPQTVLTSFHVIDTLLDAQGKMAPDAPTRIRVAFDELNGLGTGAVVPVHEKWLVDYRNKHDLEDPANSIPLDWDTVPDTGFDIHLDFALLRLARTIGRERGFYHLDPAIAPAVGESAQVTLLQHPAGTPLASSSGVALKLWPDSFKTRFHHDANSMSGSSGGLLVNNEYKPVGLHQCAYMDGKTVLFNGAITTSSIARVRPPMDSVLGFDPIWELGPGEPVIGRDDFQRNVLDAIQGRKRILTVAGDSKSGRSFTTKILQKMLGATDHQITDLSASHLQVTARDGAQAILQAVAGTGAAVPPMPETSVIETAQAAWVGSDLFPAFVAALEQVGGHRTQWLVLDDVDRYTIANTSIRVFLEVLYAGIEGVKNLRIVLIGFVPPVPGARPAVVQPEQLRDFNVIELEQYIARESTKRKITRQKGEALRTAQDILDLDEEIGKLTKAQQAVRAAKLASKP